MSVGAYACARAYAGERACAYAGGACVWVHADARGHKPRASRGKWPGWHGRVGHQPRRRRRSAARIQASGGERWPPAQGKGSQVG
eukprot:scaffold24137_cov101-Isochrysis_galbana.AAC.2